MQRQQARAFCHTPTQGVPLRPKTLTDSSDAVANVPLLDERLTEDGYLFLGSLLNPRRVMNVRAQILDALEVHGWLEERSEPQEARPSKLIRREGDENWWLGYGAIQSLYDFHDLMHDKVLTTLVELLTDSQVVVHPRSIARVTYPASDYPTPPHQDFPLIQGSADVFTAWIPLGDISPEMGGLHILRGSHRGGLQAPIAAHGPGGLGVQADLDDDNWLTTNYRVGDVLLFHSLTVHYAPANRSDRLRLSADARYQRATDPIVAGSLLPHCHPNVASWDVLTSNWPDRRPLAVPENLTVVDQQAPMEAVAPESRIAFRGGI